MKTIIVGAGLSGLMLAQHLISSREVLVIDKARGVGGRLATRRSDHAKFDHGAQFYRLKEPLRLMHERWLQRSLVQLWFTENEVHHFNAPAGMTALAKDLAQDLSISLNERVVKVVKEISKWGLTLESGKIETADEVIFTSPVPQSLQILKTSDIAYPSELDEVLYSKALVVLIEDVPNSFNFGPYGYIEPENDVIFSVADQRAKLTSPLPALTVTLERAFSESHFDAAEDQVIAQALAELKRLFPAFEPGKAQLKKWRYCQVQKPFGQLYAKINDGLYLAGDGFGGASMNGAARSANALATFLQK